MQSEVTESTQMNTLKLNRRNWKKCLASIDILAIRQADPKDNPYILEIAFFRKPRKEGSKLLDSFHEEVLDCQKAGIFYLDYSEIASINQSIEKQNKVIKPEKKIENFIDELFKILPRQSVWGLSPKTQYFLKEMVFDDQYEFLRAALGKPRVMRFVMMTDGQPVFYHLNVISKFYLGHNLYSYADLFGIFAVLSDNVGNDFDNPLKIVKKE